MGFEAALEAVTHRVDLRIGPSLSASSKQERKGES